MKKILKPGIHYLFIFIPISIILENMDASAPLIFFSAALSIIPIAHLIGSSTEQLVSNTGDAVGGLLNAMLIGGGYKSLELTGYLYNLGFDDPFFLVTLSVSF